MDLSDALGEWPGSGANNQSGGSGGGPWPGQPANPAWPSQPTGNPTWPGGPAGGGGAWPGGPAGGPAGGGGAWPGGPAGPAGGPAGGGGAWPGGPAGGPAGPGGAWPGGPAGPAGPGGAWPGGPAGPAGPAGPGGAWPGGPAGPAGPAGPGGAWPGGPAGGGGPGTAPQQSVAVPFSQNLPNGVYDKLLITINGVIKPNPNKITVDLSTSQDLAFHFNPRFNEDGRKVIVRNSCIGKKWGKEERELQNFPFVPGQPFEMKIMCTSREFKVAVNNSHLLEYKHRITDLRSIKRLNIYNDLSLSRVNMETLP
ncbi:galectin-3b isoform X2 [Scomber scombrus]|uniref:galectin-3b isoform X2 n=1 Tax=Scomber scombrus TaxID=13677 RepID=UPI002DDA91B3|nr:galectin-3b isoform X2 [Scomber scombrus]